jgi:hypothetical protein
MNLTDLVTGGVGSKAIETISKLLVSESKAKWIVAAAVPFDDCCIELQCEKQRAGRKY